MLNVMFHMHFLHLYFYAFLGHFFLIYINNLPISSSIFHFVLYGGDRSLLCKGLNVNNVIQDNK